jgi:hypothetical protein
VNEKEGEAGCPPGALRERVSPKNMAARWREREGRPEERKEWKRNPLREEPAKLERSAEGHAKCRRGAKEGNTDR